MKLPALVPYGNDQLVNIWVTGIEMCHGCNSQLLAHRGPGRFHPVSKVLYKEFLDLLDDDTRTRAEQSQMVMVDARGPSEAKPSSDQMVPCHVGTHPVILQQVLYHRGSIEAIGHQLKTHWPMRVMGSGQGPIGILVYGKSGKHRSVAWASLLNVFLLSLGYRVCLDLSTMNQEGTCDMAQCPECQEPLTHSVMNQAIVGLSMVGHTDADQ